ncbi:MAG: hypothetical protein EP344_04815 [Bacteroidetes bacterium]|nr:MAG: hypothetical protein EP344_04815 [Bacteroidota bacterium]
MGLLIGTQAVQAQQAPKRIVLPPALAEVSGMVHTPSGELWMLNDSRNPSELFRYDPVGDSLLEVRTLPIPNRDWEDLTSDPAGNLYIGDFGNNNNARQDLRIFRYNPVTGSLDSIRFRYPDQEAFPPPAHQDWNFNCEAFVYFQDSLHLFSKSVFKSDHVTKHYVLPAQPGVYVAQLRDSLVLKNRVITGAALSPDGRTLALTSYMARWRWGFIPCIRMTAYFFTDYSGSAFLQGKRRAKRLPRFLFFRQYESITWWSDNTWLVANESTQLERPAVRTFRGEQ